MSEPIQPQPGQARDGDVAATAPLTKVTYSDAPLAVHGQLLPPSHPRGADPARNQPPARPRGTQRRDNTGYLLKGLGLLAVSVISGMTWYLTHHDTGPVTDHASRTVASSSGRFDFTRAGGPVRDLDCAAHSYDRVQTFFASTPCEQLTRTLYTSQPAAGRTTVSSVSVVRMADPRAARRLVRLTNSDGTGNVRDLPADGVTVPGAPATLSGGGYASSVHRATVTIVESDFTGQVPDTRASGQLLVRVSRDALRLGRS